MEEGRPLEMRDSTIVKRELSTRRGKGHLGQTSTLSSNHQTPWGTVIGSQGQQDATPSKKEPSRASNHYQNHENGDIQGGYSTPDVTPAHNHFQNNETFGIATQDRLKLNSSKINDGTFNLDGTKTLPEASGTVHSSPAACRLKMIPGSSHINESHDVLPVDPTKQQAQVHSESFECRLKEPITRLKMAPGKSKINSGHGLFGEIGTEAERPQSRGAIKPHWPGYTTAGAV